MTTPRQIEANRRNAQKSTGPRTAEGKERSRFNAVKHGMTARFDVLPGDDAEAFRERMDSWMADLQPRNELERELAERAVRVSWRLDRVERAHVERLTANILKATSGENEAVENDVRMLGERLFRESQASDVPLPVDVGPTLPALIVLRLESTAPGCRWLMDRWADLRSLLEHPAEAWQSGDKIRAIRLLGREPIEALDDSQVIMVFLACHTIDPGGGGLFREIDHGLSQDDATIVKELLASRALDFLRPRDHAEAREALFQMVDRAVARLEVKFEAHQRMAEIDVATAPQRLAFDMTDEGERLSNYELSCGRALLRTIETFLKIRKAGTPGKPHPAAPAIDLGPVTLPTAEQSNKKNEPSSADIRTTTTDVTSPGEQRFAENEPDIVSGDGRNSDPTFAREQAIPGNEANTSYTVNEQETNKDLHRVGVRVRSARGQEPRSSPREWHCRSGPDRGGRGRGRPESRAGTPREFRRGRHRGADATLPRARDPCPAARPGA